jgi:hypothetical protein
VRAALALGDGSRDGERSLARMRSAVLKRLIGAGGERNVAAALALVDRLAERGKADAHLLNAAMKLCTSSDETRAFIQETMPRAGVAPNVVSFAQLAQRLMVEGDREAARAVVEAEMPAAGVEPTDRVRRILDLEGGGVGDDASTKPETRNPKRAAALGYLRSTLLGDIVRGRRPGWREASARLLRGLHDRGLATAHHYAKLIDGAVAAAEGDGGWRVDADPAPLAVYRSAVRGGRAELARRAEGGGELPGGRLALPTQTQPQNDGAPREARGPIGAVRIDMHEATRGVALARTTDVLLQLRQHASSGGALPSARFIVGRGRGSGVKGNSSHFQGTEPLLGEVVRGFLARTEPPLLAREDGEGADDEGDAPNRAGEVVVAAEALRAWCDGAQAAAWARAAEETVDGWSPTRGATGHEATEKDGAPASATARE